MNAAPLDREATGAGASWLGIIAVLFGLLLGSSHANEWMKLAIVGAPPFTVESMPEPDCDPDELIEEGLSLAGCHQLAYNVHDISIFSPDWFRAWHMTASAIGTLVALLSVFAGIALVDQRRWAAAMGVGVFGFLALVDIAQFIAIIYTGPLVRQMYLWDLLLWFALHTSMTVAAIVVRRHDVNSVSHREQLQPGVANVE